MRPDQHDPSSAVTQSLRVDIFTAEWSPSEPMGLMGEGLFARGRGSCDMPPFASPIPPHWSTQGPLRRTLLEPQQQYLTYAAHLLPLIPHGQGDCDEPMRLRAPTAPPWARMTAEQQMHVSFVLDEMDREADPRARLRISS